MKLLIILSLLGLSGCVSRIEERCLYANLKIDSLIIEDTLNNYSHAKVECSSKEDL